MSKSKTLEITSIVQYRNIDSHEEENIFDICNKRLHFVKNGIEKEAGAFFGESTTAFDNGDDSDEMEPLSRF